MLTLSDLLHKLKQIDEVSLLEVLDISSEDIVNRFTDIIEEKYDELYPDFADEEEEGPHS